MNDKIEIPLSKSKIIVLLAGSLIFVSIGILFIYRPDSFTTSVFNRPQYILVAGIFSALIFGLCGLFLGRKLFDSKVGLTVDHHGITDNSSGTSIGLIEWEDIQGIEVLQVASTKFVLLVTDQPEKYIARAPSGLAKRAMKANYQMYGSPICISSNALKIRFAELQSLLVDEFQKRLQN
ncbi:MAG: hypothetical protein OER04_16785 [Cyclobacteriaceae bacterium]|nr:hypothetical protein [Cyclobacteriaceae bacterium]